MNFMNRGSRARGSRYHRRMPADLPLLRSHRLPVGGGHELQVQEFGHPGGIAAVVLHGGPGSGSSPVLRRGFDGARWRVVCIDQRGAGASRPRGAIEHNTTDDLVADMRLVRGQLGIERWLVAGGSWGATLALAYAAAEPRAVSALLLRASFLARAEDIAAFFAPAAAPHPGAWQALHAVTGDEPLRALARLLHEGELDDRRRAAAAWWAWEQALATGAADALLPSLEALDFQVDRLRVQAHFLCHGCWLTQPTLLERCERVPRVPTLLLHARDDRICPPAGALALHAKLPHARLQWLAEGGHDAGHPLLTAASADALANFAAGGDFAR